MFYAKTRGLFITFIHLTPLYMPWNPELYEDFKDIRNQPFHDLLGFIQPHDIKTVIDLGCGTGQQTATLAERFPDASVLGIDASAEMLQRSNAFKRDNLDFKRLSTEEAIAAGEKWDLIFSNAALQWSDNHQKLFPQLLAMLHPDGQFVVQMPVQTENVLNKLLLETANEEPFAAYLRGWKKVSPLLTMDEYAQLLFDAGLVNLRIEQRVYPIIATDHDTLFQFIAGSALIPYTERLKGEERDQFILRFRQKIAAAFPTLPAIYAFKRLLLYGAK